MTDVAKLLHEPGSIVAVVGATDNAMKYGSVIYRDLKRKGFEVYPVNPNRDTVDGDPTFARVGDLPTPPTVVNFVVPPDETMKVIRECLELGIVNVWIQPGAESPAVLRFLQEHDFNYLANSCIMVRSRSVAHS